MPTVTYRIKTLQYPNLLPILILENQVNGSGWEWLISTQDSSWLHTWLKKSRIKIDREQNVTVIEE